jgi:hypothetical protein
MRPLSYPINRKPRPGSFQNFVDADSVARELTGQGCHTGEEGAALQFRHGEQEFGEQQEYRGPSLVQTEASLHGQVKSRGINA